MLDSQATLEESGSVAGLAAVRLTRNGGAPLALAGLERIIGLHLGICHSVLVQRLDPRLKPLGLTAKQVTILWLASANPKLTQTDIARFLQIERATIHQFTRSLLKNGMIVIEPSPNDGRATRVRVTDAGRLALAKAQQVIVEHEVENTAVLSAAEQRQLLALLTKLHGAQSSD